MSLKLMQRIFVGEGFHRSGWPHAMHWMLTKQSSDGVLVDDFVEQTFLYGGRNNHGKPHKEPWIGFFHHPPDAPQWFWPDQKLQYLWQREKFLESLPHMIGAVALSEHLGKWLRDTLDVPVKVLKHPAMDIEQKWQEPSKQMLLSFGWYLRDTRILWRVPKRHTFSKLRLWPGKPNMVKYDHLVMGNLGEGQCGGVEQMGYVTHGKLDALLSSSIGVCWVLDASATNGVLDCISRNTPLFVNRHPAVVEYLGDDYPLYYEDPKEIPDRLGEAKVASEYLADMDKSWMSGESFAEQVAEFANQVRDRSIVS